MMEHYVSGTKKRQSFFTTDAGKLPESLMTATATKDKGPKTLPTLKAQTQGQKAYIRKLVKSHHDITFVTGPAGTGKTYLAVIWAVHEWLEGRCDKIVITRPNVGAGEDLGYLPGSLNEKMEPWMLPILDTLKECFSVYEVEQMIRKEQIEIAPFAFMRGRTFKNAIVIADEAQNTTVEQMKMLMTRIGNDSRMVITGDTEQHDRGHEVSGLFDITQRIERKNRERFGYDLDEVDFHPTTRQRIGLVRLGRADVVRHPVIEEVLALYD